MQPFHALFVVLASLAASLLAVGPCRADDANSSDDRDTLLELRSEPSTVIDLLIENQWRQAGAKPTARCDDNTFVRRLYLDLVGRIPTTAERRRFLESTASDKRGRLAEQLLSTDEFARRMREAFDVAFLGRASSRGELNRRRDNHWWTFLEKAFDDNRSWNEVVETMLLARSVNDRDRGAAWFLYARNDKHQDIAEAVSRSVFGIQIQCAQCHDHPLAFEIEQRHYWGLVAFFNRGKNAKTKRGPQMAESAIGGFAKFSDLNGESNIAKLVFFQSDGEREIPEPDTVNADTKDAPNLYLDASQNLPKEPKFSRRRAFVEKIARDNRLVSRAMVNRIWALLMGRGIVHPVDAMDSEHPPSHPRLLKWLEHDFHRSGGDVKRLIRAIVASRAYQLTSVGDSDPALFARGLEKPLTAETLYRSVRIALQGSPDNEDQELLFEFQKAFPDVFPIEIVANLKQSLMLANNPRLFALTEAKEGNLTTRIADEKVEERIAIVYETILGRQPEASEVTAIQKHFEAKTDSKNHSRRAAQELVWALITSPEFRFNH